MPLPRGTMPQGEHFPIWNVPHSSLCLLLLLPGSPPRLPFPCCEGPWRGLPVHSHAGSGVTQAQGAGQGTSLPFSQVEPRGAHCLPTDWVKDGAGGGVLPVTVGRPQHGWGAGAQATMDRASNSGPSGGPGHSPKANDEEGWGQRGAGPQLRGGASDPQLLHSPGPADGQRPGVGGAGGGQLPGDQRRGAAGTPLVTPVAQGMALPFPLCPSLPVPCTGW